MENTLLVENPKSRWLAAAISALLLVTILGVLPFEQIFPIEIRNSVLVWLTSGLPGLCGLFALLCVLMIQIMKYGNWLSGLVMLIVPVLLVFIAFAIFIGIALPQFDWQDTIVYRNVDDYLVIQKFQDFVTSSPTSPRLLRTTSPFGIVRVIEERHVLTSHDDQFGGDKVIYEAKMWNKVSIPKGGR